jgi:hypothetical protein
MTVFLETSNIILPNTYLAKVKRKTPVLFAGFFFFLLLYPTIQYLTTPCMVSMGPPPFMVSMGPRLYGQYGATSVWSVWGHVTFRKFFFVFLSCIFILASFAKMSAKLKQRLNCSNCSDLYLYIFSH